MMGLVCDHTDKHRDMSFRFQAICSHASSEQPYLPEFLKPKVYTYSPIRKPEIN